MNIGDQVICIMDDWFIGPEKALLKPTLPIKGCVYTIRDIFRGYPNPYNEYIGLVFEEFINPLMWDLSIYREINFNSFCFRPVKKTNIEQFKGLLNPSKDDTKKFIKEMEETL